MIAQCKGKDLSNVSASKIVYEGWLLMPKYDGNYVQIHKVGPLVTFYTSGGKQFHLHYLAREICKIFAGYDIVLEAEYIGNSGGMLGDRIKAAKLTTYRICFSKGQDPKVIVGHDKFRIFDILKFTNMSNFTNFEERAKILQSFTYTNSFELAPISGPFTLGEAVNKSKEYIAEGYEGCFIKSIYHINIPGTRVNNAIKLKARPTADLLCIGITKGEGKYATKIGSLILQDKTGRICNVGSGLTDTERNLPRDYFIGKIVEITYEQILTTYIQPTYSCIRADKTESD